MKRSVAAFALLIFAGCGAKVDKQPASAAGAERPRSNEEGPGVSLTKDARERAGIRVEALTAQPMRPELTAYGRLEEDPAESFVVRAGLPGTLRPKAWPALGQTVAPGTELGGIEPRLAVTDRISLTAQLTTVRADLNASSAAVAAAQKVYDRTRVLNADDKNVSDRALQDSESKLIAEKAREAGLRSSMEVLEKALAGGVSNTTTSVTAGFGGEVVEVLAHPDESVEEGEALLRLARFNRLLARIDLPIGQQSPALRSRARVIPAGFERQAPIEAEPIGAAPAADAQTQGVSLLYRLTQSHAQLRPGMPVSLRFTLSGASQTGVLIPRRAVVQQDGRLWAYVQTQEIRFARRSVPTDMPTSSGFLTANGFAPGDLVVVTGAQTLLSEEFKSQNEADTN